MRRPAGFVTRWEKQSAPDEGKAPAEPGSAGPAAPALLALMAACALAMLWFAKLAEGEARPAPAGESPSGGLALALVLAAALVTRLVTAGLVRGFPVDIGGVTGWAAQMAEVGPGRFYVSDIFSDYPPGYMLVLWPLGLVAKAMGSLGTAALPLLVKLPAVACDLGIVLIIYSTARKRVGGRAALFLSMLYAFSPLPYLAGSAWGQADSVPALLLVIAVLMIMEGKWRWALPVYVLAVLMKPQALMAGPHGGADRASGFFKRRAL